MSILIDVQNKCPSREAILNVAIDKIIDNLKESSCDGELSFV